MEFGHFFWAVRSPFHLALDGLWMGVICALILHWRPTAVTENPEIRRRLLTGGSTLVAVLLMSAAWFDDRHFGASVVVLTLVSAGMASIVLAVALGPTFMSAWLRARWLRFMAEISYSVYLTHLIVVWPAMRAMRILLSPWSDPSPLLQFAVFLPLFLAFSLAAGLILHFLVEKPFLMLKDRVRMPMGTPARAERPLLSTP
jgi:peptidoglycan/LPS O-acetylase OafA/YrhL